LAHNEFVPVEMSRDRFEELVGEALDEVPVELLSLMNNVVFLKKTLRRAAATTCSGSTREPP